MDREQLRAKYGDEEVLVVRQTSLPELLDGRNLDTSDSSIRTHLLNESFFYPRFLCEGNSEYVQFIPYCCFVSTDNRVFLMKRLSGSGESRLVDKMSLGVGGHVNPISNLSSYDLFTYSLHREISEELTTKNPGYLELANVMISSKILYAGLIRETRTSVGRDHIGLLYFVVIPEELADHITIRETDVLEGEFVPFESVRNIEGEIYDKLENWSKIVVSQYPFTESSLSKIFSEE